MLEEIRSFFREVREEPVPAWPEGLSPIDPPERDLSPVASSVRYGLSRVIQTRFQCYELHRHPERFPS